MSRHSRSVVLAGGAFWLAVAVAMGGELPGHVRFALPFEDGLHAGEGAANPFVAAGNVDVVECGGARGRVLRLRALRPDAAAALVIDGSNVPGDSGTFGAWFRWRATEPGRPTWLLTLVPYVGEPYGGPTQLRGTALAVLGEPDGTVALVAFQLGGSGPGILFTRGTIDNRGTPYVFQRKLPTRSSLSRVMRPAVAIAQARKVILSGSMLEQSGSESQ